MTGLDSDIATKQPHIGATDLPDPYQDGEGEASPPPPSLFDDLAALFEDGKTYAQAEVAYQKSRAGYVGEQTKFALAYGAGALGLFHLAAIALTVGLLISLMTLVGPWIATAIVTLALGVLGLVLARKLRAKMLEIRSAFAEDGK